MGFLLLVAVEEAWAYLRVAQRSIVKDEIRHHGGSVEIRDIAGKRALCAVLLRCTSCLGNESTPAAGSLNLNGPGCSREAFGFAFDAYRLN